GHYFNLSIPLIALSGAALILLLGKAKPSLVVQKVDWVLLLFFASLFIVVEGVQKTALMQSFLNAELLSDNAVGLGWLHGISLMASQIVSNVPFAVLMLPLLQATQSEMLWLGLASASTLAGNATIIGAMANLIVIESADKYGIRLGFMTFFRVGIVVTLLSLVLSFVLLYAEFLLL
ncbi:MAG: SLC13 family permease, partial [Bacteroidales bacterium]|nr:SLC13 family permease [Bacteroidales bacterium]